MASDITDCPPIAPLAFLAPSISRPSLVPAVSQSSRASPKRSSRPRGSRAPLGVASWESRPKFIGRRRLGWSWLLGGRRCRRTKISARSDSHMNDEGREPTMGDCGGGKVAKVEAMAVASEYRNLQHGRRGCMLPLLECSRQGASNLRPMIVTV